MTLSLAMSMGLTAVQSPPATAPADDTTPDAFDFTAVTGADRSTLYVSNTVTISGINAPSPVTVSGGQYRKNGGSWTSTAGEVVNGDVLQVRGTSSASYLTPVNVTLTVGGVSDTFTITTAAEAPDTTPDAFTFADVADAERSTVYTSNIVTIAGINAAAAVSVTGGEYRKNGGAWTTSAGTVVAGDTLQVRGTSSASYTADVNVTLTVGGVADTYTITTKADPVAVSQIVSVKIWGATPLDATGDYGDATARTGVDGNGWVGEVIVPLRAAATFDPTKLLHVIDSPSFGPDTTPTTLRREIRGTVVLRRQYPAHASKMQSDDGLHAKIYYALQETVYAGCTLVSVTAEPGYYADLTPGSVSTVANNSTRTYPKALAAWVNTQENRATGSTYAVELAAAHDHGRNGRMVACVQFIATDGNSHTAATQTTSTPSLSSLQTQGNPTEVYKASIPLSALDAGGICQVNAKVYPWIGDASAVLDLAVDGYAWPTANPQTPLRFLNDKNGTYGGAIAFWRAGAGGTGVVSRNEATARASPFATLALASAALAAFNNANSTPAHNDHSGSTIYAMDDGAGGDVVHTIPASITTPAGNCWTEVKPDPAAVGAVSLLMDNARGVPNKFKFFLNITHTAGNGFDGGSTANSKMLAFAGGTITSTSTVPLHYRNGLVSLANVTIIGTAQRNMLAGYANTRTQTALALGVIAEGATGDGNVLPYAMIGCRLRRLALQEITPASMPSNDDQDGMFVMNTWFREVRSSGTLPSLISNRPWSRGLAVVQNLFEGGVPNATGLRLGGDGTSMACDNVVFDYNTIVGGRINHGYTDVAAVAGVLRRLRMRFNICNDTWNCKTDTFTTNTTVTGRVGNWEHLHNVGNKGNVVTGGSANNSAPNPDTSWLGPWWPAATYNVGAGNVTFTDDKSLPIGSGALGGTYSLTGSTNAAYDQVGSGEAKLAYDIAGNARRNNGTGASGCYERAA